jgi:hypothetical protein
MSVASGSSAGLGNMPSSGAGGTADSIQEHNKSCPLLSMGLTSGTGKTRMLPCGTDECAWWNRTAKRCAVVAGYEH